MKRWFERTWRLLWSERPQPGQTWLVDGIGQVFVEEVLAAPGHELWGWGRVVFRSADGMTLVWGERAFRREATWPTLGGFLSAKTGPTP